MSEALGKIRAALKGHDLLGAEAIELRPGSVVLVVLRHPQHADRYVVEQLCKIGSGIAETLQAEGVGGTVTVLPEDFGLDVIEVADAPPARVPWVGDLVIPGEAGATIERYRVALANRSGETAVDLPKPPEVREP